MQSTVNPKPTDPDDVVVIAPDVVRVAPGDKEPADPARDAKARPSDPQARAGSSSAAGTSVPPVDTTFRAAAVNTTMARGEGRSFGRRLMRVVRSFLIALALAAGSGAIAYGWQNYGDDAKEIIAERLPRLIPTSFSLPSIPSLSRLSPSPSSSPSSPSQDAAEQPGQAAAETVATNAASTPPEPAAPASDAAAPAAAQASEGAAPVAALSVESAQLLQSMAHDLSTVGQEIAQLKASIEQLKVSQEQMARELAKAREQNARPKVAVAVPPLRPPGTLNLPMPARRPTASYPPQAAMAAPPSRTGSLAAGPSPRSGPAGSQAVSAPVLPYAGAPPLSLQPEPPAAADEQDGPVVRPPMPVR